MSVDARSVPEGGWTRPAGTEECVGRIPSQGSVAQSVRCGRNQGAPFHKNGAPCTYSSKKGEKPGRKNAAPSGMTARYGPDWPDKPRLGQTGPDRAKQDQTALGWAESGGTGQNQSRPKKIRPTRRAARIRTAALPSGIRTGALDRFAQQFQHLLTEGLQIGLGELGIRAHRFALVTQAFRHQRRKQGHGQHA